MRDQDEIQRQKPQVRFDRRDLLKVLTSIPASALVPLNAGAAAKILSSRQAQRGAAAAAGLQLKVLTLHEYTTIRTLGDLIIPADERSGGASDAGVPDFIDDWLDFQRGELLDSIRGGLTWLDVECNRSFGKDFVDCAAEQQKQILDRIAYPQQASSADQPGVEFFNRLRDLVVSGFYTSEIGLRDLPYLGNEPQVAWQGCPAPVLAKLDLGK